MLSKLNPIKKRSFINFPKRKKFSWKKFRFYGVRVLIAFVALIVLLFAWYAKDLPTPGKIKNYQAAASTQLFDRNNKPIYALHGDIQRDLIESNDIPETIKQATVATEDKSFYKNHGIEFKAILRAAYGVITGVNKGGGSTITQQFVKNALLDPQRSYTRKIKELILSIEIEMMYNKDQILTMYLNEIPYGNNAYGVQAASKVYFNKDAKDLTLAESATLAALPQRPTYFSPYGTHPDARINRVNFVLDSMVSMKYIDKDQAGKAKEEAKNMKFAQPKEYIVAPHFVQYVKDQLVTKYGEQMVNEGGLQVTTTLDLDKQVLAEKAVQDAAGKRFNNINASNAALVSIDPKTGQIIAMVGSADYFNDDIDGQVNVADSLRQPGSSFKPIVYATAFKDKYNPAFTLWDVTTDFGGGYTPKNYDGNTHGPVSMRTALSNSLNIPAVKTLYLAGIDKSLETAHEMGITSLKGNADQYGLSLVLGSGEVKLSELTSAYGTFGNNGTHAPMTPILKVVDAKGKTVDEFKDGKGKEVLDPQIAYEISSILSDNDARSMVFGSRSTLYIPDRPDVAVKTGTTSLYKDAWTIGYTPSVVTGVWVGNNDNKPMTAGAAGAMAAAPIWRQYMQSVLGDNESFTKPDGIQNITVDKLSNKLPTSNSPETISDIFSTWQAPKKEDDIHVTIKIDKFTGKRATDDCPNQFTEERTYTDLHSEVPNNSNWEGPVRAAAERFGINISYAPEEKSCMGLSGKPTISFVSPINNATTDGKFTISVSANSAAGIKKVDFAIDGVFIGTVAQAPYSISSPGLSSGKHNITATATTTTDLSESAKINITVKKSISVPDSPTFNSVSGGVESATISWTNASSSALTSVRIYASETQGQLGIVVATVDANPSQSQSTTVNDLDSGQIYWFTLKSVDSSGHESTNNTQHSALIL